MGNLYEKLLKWLGFQPPDATGETGYPKWLLDLPLFLRWVVLLFLIPILWLAKKVSRANNH